MAHEEAVRPHREVLGGRHNQPLQLTAALVTPAARTHIDSCVVVLGSRRANPALSRRPRPQLNGMYVRPTGGDDLVSSISSVRIQALLAATLVLACSDDTIRPLSAIETTIKVSHDRVRPGDAIAVTVEVFNRGTVTEEFHFGCGYRIGIAVLDETGAAVVWDHICPTEYVEVELAPGESIVRTSDVHATSVVDGSPIAPGHYTVSGGLSDGYSKTWPWAEAALDVFAE